MSDPEQERRLDREVDFPDPQAAGAATEPADGPQGPYRNLLVPLVVVPALIVMVGVVIVALFGLLGGEVRSPRENLDRLLSGGANERQQAAFELVRQILDYQTASGEERDPEWGIDERFLDDLRTAAEAAPPPATARDVWVPFVLASLRAQLGEPDGVRALLDTTRLGEDLDPGFEFGQNAVFILGSIGEELPSTLRDAVAARMIELLDHEREGIVGLAAGALQNLDTPEARGALTGLLGNRRLDTRLQAAISLAELGDASGAGVLLAAVEPEPYAAERAEHPYRWPPQTVSETRRKALLALRLVDRLPPDEVLDRLADEDDDPNVRSLAIELRAGARAGRPE